MRTDQHIERRRPQFTIRTALLIFLLVALAFGWYKSIDRVRQQNAELWQHLRRSNAEVRRAHREIENCRFRAIGTVRSSMSDKGALSDACFDGTNLRSISILGGVFQQTSFNECDLREASLSGGNAAFQGAQFSNANLTNAKLTGGSASFQLASFANADLSGAVLTGGGHSLQGASFERAKLIGSQVRVSGFTAFQGVNINGTQFQDADLSTIDASSLESCYFETPPLYDKTTKFPIGFNPKAHGWSLVD